jgi:hypothetical protein
MKRIASASLTLLVYTLAFIKTELGATRPQSRDQQSCPDITETKGEYINVSYGFSILIPNDLKGVWNSARCVAGKDGCVCMSDHGRIIPLATDTNDSDHWIEAYAGFATDVDNPSPENEGDKHLGWIRERSRGGSVSILKRSNVVLGGLRGKRAVVRYYDKESKRVMVEDFVELLRGRKEVEVEYSLYLRAPERAYARDRTVFETILHSFALKKCDDC